MKKLTLSLFSCFLLVSAISAQVSDCGNIVSIPLNGNTYVTDGVHKRNFINEDGIYAWNDPSFTFSSWFKVSKPGQLNISLRAKTYDKGAKIKVTAHGKPFDISMKNKTWAIIPVGQIDVSKAGYIKIDFQGLEKKGDAFADISDIIISGPAAEEPLSFLREFETYWGRRGPSVHMGYTLPENEDIEWFYNEVTVPKGNDVIGSYYMANGFGGGYFGMQANSPTERRILFSVWSPYETDDPKSIPEEYQVKTLARGEGVHIGEFGNEGSGGQSYLIYPWKTDVTYKFLTRIHPDGKGNTVFTAYFYATDENRWRLIASFLRPKTDLWYTGAHSFLENFIPEQGNLTRKVYFGNQWLVTSRGKWMPVTKGRFTYDATATAGVRKDYKGGVEDNRFFLQNCGFFDDNTDLFTIFDRTANSAAKPKINLKKLPLK
ncbi:DUF3472 domain-containing protein [Prevotella sp. 10(H)]|uniref:DUF3472 domain-containing protein n=1 Tax=Prevotella sp. 10(H) TaxID=1158294 RepID=UPI0004A739A9|nr:DUF3472 domain-containing protein [Prevotella sp. 10(H)]